LKRAAPKAITDPFRGVFRGVYSFPQLDTYRHARREPVLGPIEAMPALTPLPAKRRLFAYSASDYALVEQVVQALMHVGPEAEAYFRGSLGARASVLTSRGVRVHEQAPSLGDVLPGVSAVFSHGGTGFTNAALAAGRPQVVTPRHFEATATARALEAIGAGICVLPFDAGKFRDAVKRAQDDGAMRAAAQTAGEAAQAFLKSAAPLETTMARLRAVFA
jgi:UDP:flavonoid glycosyltransferase YjiC (YdhE family)